MNKVLIIGGGAFGSALAIASIEANLAVTILVRNLSQANEINNNHTNHQYLPNITLPSAITAITLPQISENLSDFNLIILALPSSSILSMLSMIHSQLLPELSSNFIDIIIASKGLDHQHKDFFSSTVSKLFNLDIAFLSGPTFARELAQKLSTSCMIAHKDLTKATKLAQVLSNNYFALYPTDDIVTIQLGGSYKNILAIYCGYIMGKQLGENFRAQICIEGLKELAFITTKLGGNGNNAYSLAGAGDIMLSCFSATSRNFQFGQNLAHYHDNIHHNKSITMRNSLIELFPSIEGLRALEVFKILCRDFSSELKILPQIFELYNKIISA